VTPPNAFAPFPTAGNSEGEKKEGLLSADPFETYGSLIHIESDEGPGMTVLVNLPVAAIER
jgi:hypothetical protein